MQHAQLHHTMHGLPLRSAAVVFLSITIAVDSCITVVYAESIGDSVREARCIAKCHHHPAPQQPKCYSSCLNEPWIKPGGCPVADLDDVSLDRPCLEQCSADDFCDGQRLPDKPTVVAVEDYGKPLVVEWTPVDYDSNSHHVTYLLQERHHAGVKYVPERMTPWTIVTRTDKTREPLKRLQTVGRWFQFRVAAVNENGTRGYSQPCVPFFVDPGSPIEPPGPPENVKVSSLKWTNDDYQQCVLSWSPPANSALPIRKYKVYISEQDGYHLYHKRHVLPADILRFHIKKLNTNSEYFLQVQAISEFGRKKLAGQKASVTLKTEEKKLSVKMNKINGLKVVNYYNSTKNDLFNVKISWRPVSMTSKKLTYTLTCIPQNCKFDSKTFNATTIHPFFDMFSLNRMCKYLIIVSTNYDGSKHMASLTFSVQP
ncbi:anosmin-1 isoform X2 [Daktulosphaira vitifoliae]|uniref:anosmin-1 isoform X2 n=1 Tax=Daktulosphaira vitifoliae TaxID=58002 RepID=UPI0021A9DFAD|nr:anosmin-1 isoform X2 [Daktulosphaira vitifoliae]